MTAKIIARKIGLNSSSNGQLTKTALEASGLAARWFATQLLGLRPKCVADRLSRGGTPARYGGNLDAPIDNRPIEHRQRSFPRRFLHYLRHDVQYATLQPLAQDPIVHRNPQKLHACQLGVSLYFIKEIPQHT